ncbi:unnamed protein product [Closterium sp. NIES-65]|nr:unnamed protein product [Closterium sp. NIES-65]
MDRISLPSPLSHSLASPRARLGPWLLPPDRRTVAATFNGVNGADRDNSVNRVSGVNGVNRVSQVSRNSDRDSLIPSRFFTSLSSRASLCAKSHVFLRQSACASPRPSPCLSASPSASIWASTSCAHPGEETLRRPGAPRGGAGRIGAPLAGLQLRAALPLVARAEGGGEAGVIVARGRRYSGRGKGGEEEGEEEEDREEWDEVGERAVMHAGEEDELDKGGGSSSDREESGGGEEKGGRKKRRRRREEEKQRTREGAEASSGESLRRGVSYAEAERVGWAEGRRRKGQTRGKRGRRDWARRGDRGESGRTCRWEVVMRCLKEGVWLTTLVDGTLGAGGHTLACWVHPLHRTHKGCCCFSPPPGHSPAYAFPPSSPAAGPAPTRDTGTLLIRLYNRYDYDLARHHPELQTVVGVDPSAHHMLHCLLPSLPCLRISPTLFTSPLQLCQHHPELETVEGVHVGPSAHAIAADFASLHSFASALSCALSHFVSPLQLCQRHPELQTVVGVDVDPAAHAIAAARLHPFLRIAAPPGAKAARPQDLHAHGQAAAPVAECGQPEAHGQATLRAVETPEATLRVAEERRATATLHVVEGNFRRMVEACAGVGVGRGSVDGILLDVGVSSMQVRAGSVEVASDAGGGVLWHVRAWHVGVLSTQIDRAERGFSFLRDGPLDMRMDPKSPLTAEVAVNNWPEEVLGQILRDLGEERRWQQIARRIVEARGRGRISTTTQLAAIVAGGAYGPKKSTASSSRRRDGAGTRIHSPAPSTLCQFLVPPLLWSRHAHPPGHLHLAGALHCLISPPIAPISPLHIPCPVRPISASSSRRGGPGMRIHPATRTFQALRIAVNDELAALALAIPAALSLLAPGGRLAVISFHSLEDRIVKRSFLEAAAGVPVPMPVPVPLPVAMPVPVSAPGVGSSSGLEGHGHARYRVVTKRPVVAEEDEWRVNARSRSAKLRVVERVA